MEPSAIDPAEIIGAPIRRRALLLGGIATCLLAGCAALPPLSVDEAVRRLTRRAVERGLARLEASGGLWDHWVIIADLPSVLGPGGSLLQRALISPAFHRRLDEWLRPVALRAARAAAPRIAAAVKVMGVANARAVIAGGPRAATALLRSQMGPAVLEAMFPEFRDALHLLDDPLLGPLITALPRDGIATIARWLARRAENVLWDAIGEEEQAIRADPGAGGDPDLARVLN